MTYPGSGRERIHAQRTAAAEQQKQEDHTELLAGIGVIATLAAYAAGLVGLTWLSAYLVSHALAAYGITQGGVAAPFILIVVAESVIAFGVGVGVRRGTKSLPKRFAEEIDKLIRR